LELNAGPPLWQRFVQLVNKRYGPPLSKSPIGELAVLRCVGSVDNYTTHFMVLSCHDMVI
jgi:hypothetical protein